MTQMTICIKENLKSCHTLHHKMLPKTSFAFDAQAWSPWSLKEGKEKWIFAQKCFPKNIIPSLIHSAQSHFLKLVENAKYSGFECFCSILVLRI